MPVHNSVTHYELNILQAPSYDEWYLIHFQPAPMCLFIYGASVLMDTLPAPPQDTAHHCNGQFGEGAVKAETLLLASPLCKNNPALLQNCCTFQRHCYQQLVVSPPHLKPFFLPFDKEQGTRLDSKSHAGAWMPTHPRQECCAWEVPTECLLLYLAWLALPSHSTVCTASGRVEGNNVLSSQAKHGEVESCCSASWRWHRLLRQVHLSPGTGASCRALY